MVQAFAAIHSNDILHRDMKPQNILIGQDGKIKICDFGESKVLNPDQSRHLTDVGTYQYRSYEMQIGIGFSQCSDVFGIGIVMYQLLLLPGEHNDDINKIEKKHSQNKFLNETELQKKISPKLRDMIYSLIQWMYWKRPTILDLLNCEEIQKYIDKNDQDGWLNDSIQKLEQIKNKPKEHVASIIYFKPIPIQHLSIEQLNELSQSSSSSQSSQSSSSSQ
ncbi:MAG: hypothetical protein EZS28_029209, partial [Streblomastix strix]